MRIIPVIDILNGIAVGAVRGERKKYKPLKSEITNITDPASLLEFYKNYFGFEEFYVADLDGIIHGAPNIGLIEELSEIGNVIVDIGIRNYTDIIKINNLPIGVIFGTESLEEISLVNTNFSGKKILSIDMKQGKLLSANVKIKDLDILLDKINDLKINEILIVNLSSVGSNSGPDNNLINKIKNKSNFPVLYGGGIRDINDIKSVREIGINGVLIGTSLHNGKIKRNDIEDIMLE